MATDVSNPLPDGSFDLDISTDALGSVPVAAPVLERAAGLLLGSALVCALRAAHQKRRER